MMTYFPRHVRRKSILDQIHNYKISLEFFCRAQNAVFSVEKWGKLTENKYAIQVRTFAKSLPLLKDFHGLLTAFTGQVVQYSCAKNRPAHLAVRHRLFHLERMLSPVHNVRNETLQQNVQYADSTTLVFYLASTIIRIHHQERMPMP